MVVPLPWGSPPVGNPAIRQVGTYRVSRRPLVRPFIHVHHVLVHRRKITFGVCPARHHGYVV